MLYKGYLDNTFNFDLILNFKKYLKVELLPLEPYETDCQRAPTNEMSRNCHFRSYTHWCLFFLKKKIRKNLKIFKKKYAKDKNILFRSFWYPNSVR